MIESRITGLDSLKKLASNLKSFKENSMKESKSTVSELRKEINKAYVKDITNLVYDEYDPVSYERTQHLAGAYGAKQEEYDKGSYVQSYQFFIDGDSKDPVDGTTWKEKAYNVEHGYSEMFFSGQPFNRPFIDETQTDLEFRNKQFADDYEKKIKKLRDEI